MCLNLHCEVIIGNGPALAALLALVQSALLALGHSQGSSLQYSVVMREDNQWRFNSSRPYTGDDDDDDSEDAVRIGHYFSVLPPQHLQLRAPPG